jgi:hypothetical protein
MKRLLATLTLIVCLSFPVQAGHVFGSGAPCECGTKSCVEDYPGECAGHFATQQSESPTDFSGLGIVLVALLYWLRARA